MGWRVKIYGSADPFMVEFRPDRRSKRDALIIQLADRVRPVITPAYADDVTAELSTHGIAS
jgi:hypothetical protein